MQTTNEMLLDLAGQPHTKFVIPAYQRAYSWRERECRELWLDLHRAAKSGANHFMGTFLYSVENGGETEAGAPNELRRLAVVDGQQRLTTITLIIVALVRHLRAKGVSLGDATADEIESRFLFADAGGAAVGGLDAVGAADAAGVGAAGAVEGAANASAARDVKLTLSRNDRDTLYAVVRGKALTFPTSQNVIDNLAFFEGLMSQEDFDPERLWAGLKLMGVIAARVERDDPAQLIFESLNSKGLPLTTADLVRNYLLLAESHEEQTRLYDQYWEAIEGVFQPDPGSLRLDNGIQGWLSVRFRKVRAKGAGEVYSVFKQYVEDEFTGSTESLLRELRNFSLVWAENYRYHAVKKYRSSANWAVNGNATLTSGYEKKAASNQAYADKVRAELDATDASL